MGKGNGFTSCELRQGHSNNKNLADSFVQSQKPTTIWLKPSGFPLQLLERAFGRSICKKQIKPAASKEMPSHSGERTCWEGREGRCWGFAGPKTVPTIKQELSEGMKLLQQLFWGGNLGLHKSTTEPKSSFPTQALIKETAQTTSCWLPSSTCPPLPKKTHGLCFLFTAQLLPQTFFLTQNPAEDEGDRT